MLSNGDLRRFRAASARRAASPESGGQTAATLLEEGGLSDKTQTELTATGGIRVTLPAATTGATHINVYLTAANGEVPQLATVVVFVVAGAVAFCAGTALPPLSLFPQADVVRASAAAKAKIA